MTQIRTDLALEAAENLQAGGPAAGELSGVVTRTERRQGVSVTEVRILDETGARALGKPVGRYVTMELESQPFSQQAACLASLLAELLPRGPVLTAGIGNRDMTCDAIGPKWIVPMHYHHAPYGLPNITGVEDFLALWPAERVHLLSGACVDTATAPEGVLLPKF